MSSSFSIIRDQTPASAIPRGAVVAMGNFDGVHRGHRAVIAAAMAMAKRLGRPAFAVTFEPHPRSFFSPHTPQFRLTDETGKLRLLAGTGLDGAVIMTFNAARAGTSAQDFIANDLIGRLGRINVFSGLGDQARPAIDVNALHYREQIITGTTGASVKDYADVREMAASPSVDLSPVITDRFTLDEIEAAMRQSASGTGMKSVVLFD